MSLIQALAVWIRALLRDRTELATENLALRQQLAILAQCSKRPRLRNRDRIFWAWLSRFWSNWHSVLVIVQPRLGYTQPSPNGRLTRQEAFLPQTFAAAGGASVRQLSARHSHFHPDGVFRNDKPLPRGNHARLVNSPVPYGPASA